MSTEPQYLVEPDVVSQLVDDELVIVHLRTNEIYALNRTGARLWTLVDQQVELKEIRRVLLSEFDVGEQELNEELERILADLQHAGLVRKVEQEK